MNDLDAARIRTRWYQCAACGPVDPDEVRACPGSPLEYRHTHRRDRWCGAVVTVEPTD